MRATHFLALSGLMLAGKVALAAELDRDDVPNRCWDVCGPVVGIAHRCDGMHDNDRREMDCICDWKQAPSLIPLCEACIADYRADRNNTDRDRHYDEEHDLFDDDDDDDDDRDPHHNDAYDILRSCSLSTTSYNAAAATSALSATGTGSGSSSTSTGSASGSGSTTVSATDSNTSATSTNSGSSSDDSSSNGSNNNDNSNSADSSGTDSASTAQTTDNAAPGSSAPQAASLAAIVGLGFVAWL
ncbi:hypothetical protein P170DRAFT_472063 [Aspergillus steynii IBT 23096]|uniref:GPI anchored protein n=1 Tax=Aspergillus steynii IBT 23096 TaxID=1392250 RepID=A0A2I2GH46_9EURO|nr:uncharacterized protein P170DRAFT_472063 [Aspergillus steynii IBT 23096]PLB52157.1 hypothetical protein P170DRAFT_472063 [Aspergillus steynii IBT 23096]